MNPRGIVIGAITTWSAACAQPPPPSVPSDRPPTAAESADRPPPPAPSAPASGPASATEVLVGGRAPFDACYSRARSVNPQLGRTSIDIAFAVDTSGKPMTVDLKYRDRMDDTAKECMRDAALALTFPPSMQGRQAATLTFKPPAL